MSARDAAPGPEETSSLRESAALPEDISRYGVCPGAPSFIFLQKRLFLHVVNKNQMKIQIVNESRHPLPAYATEQSAGMDVRANLSAPVELRPLERKLIPTGLYIALPDGYEAQMRPRSGLAVRHGITLLNAPGTIDADYRGEIGVILVNLSNEPYVVNDGERICQMVVSACKRVEWEPVETLDGTGRGGGGFGHTGKI